MISGHPLLSLSEQQLLDCSTANGNKGCTSGTAANAFAYITANGITNETNYPYQASSNRCNKANAAKVAAKIGGTKDVLANNALALKTAIVQQPVAVPVDPNPSIWQFYSEGTVNSTNCGTSLSHEVLIVGYDLGSDVPFYIVKNSWGFAWGMGGYIQIAIVNGNGICGIQMMPLIPFV